MSKALYLISSLPDVDLYRGQEEGLVPSLEHFFDACSVLGEDLAQKVIFAVQNPKESGLRIAQDWAEYEYSIRNELGKKRWSETRTGPFVPALVNDEIPVSAEAIDMAVAVSQEENIYEKEKKIIETKWLILQALNEQYLFGVENVVIYGWQLQLYHTYYSYTTSKGKKQWNELLHSLAEKSGFSIVGLTGGRNE